MRLLFLVVLLFNNMVQAQTYHGVLRVTAMSNDDNRLEHNRQVSSVHLCVIGLKGDTILLEQADLSEIFSRSMVPGAYKLIATSTGFSPIVLEHLSISADRITFVDLLFEPEPRYRKGFATGIDRRRNKKRAESLQP